MEKKAAPPAAQRIERSVTGRIKRASFCLALQLFATGFALGATPTWIANPVQVPNADAGGIGDPEIVKHRGKYYLYSSNTNYGPLGNERVLVWESRDLANWTYRGVAATYANAWFGWAPDVLQHNGLFYMVASGDTGASGTPALAPFPAYPPYYRDHVVMQSDNPLGPFVRISDNLPASIDGHLFRDDDGKLYFFWAADGGIRYRPMVAPNTIDTAQPERQLTACSINISGPWTEGPFVWKRQGTYYLSYSGNDLMRDDYQTHVCKGTTLAGMTPQPNRVLLLDTVGSWTGSAHNTLTVGPDLVTLYTAYHERDKTMPYLFRRFGLSEAWIASDGQLRADPPESGVNVPAQPWFRDDFARDAIGAGWQQIGPSPWGIYNRELLWNDSQGFPGWQMQLRADPNSPADYVYEGSAKQWSWGSTGVSPYPKYGLFSSVLRNPSGTITDAFFFGVDARNNLLISWALVNGVDQGWQNTSMPAGWNHNAWHTLRVEKRGSTFRMYYDDMLKQTRTFNLAGGSFGVGVDNTHVDFSGLAMHPNIQGWYRITPRIAPDKSVEVGGWSTVNGGNVIQWTFFNNPNQLWWAQSRGGTGGVTWINKHSGKALTVSGASPYSGANVDQWDDVRGGNQVWIPDPRGGPWWRFLPNHAPGQCLDISTGNPANGTNVQQWECNGLTPQEFSLTPY